jgi:elongation factor Ts
MGEKVQIGTELVKKLRERTGAGIMECKRALEATGGDMAKAQDFLREHGMAKAERRAARPVSEGIIAAYLHAGGKIGVLVEASCETDFVARTDEFKSFAHEVAMQVAAQQPKYLRREDVPEETVEKEKEIYRAQALESNKPAQVVDRIAEGMLEKFYQDVCLLEQPYIRDPDKTVEALRKEASAKLGENVQIRRFARFQVGEELEPD